MEGYGYGLRFRLYAHSVRGRVRVDEPLKDEPHLPRTRHARTIRFPAFRSTVQCTFNKPRVCVCEVSASVNSSPSVTSEPRPRFTCECGSELKVLS